MLNYETGLGEHLSEVAAAMVVMRNGHREDVQAIFNEVILTATEGKTAEQIVAEYNAETERRNQEWRASPEGQASLKRREESQRVADEAAAQGVLPFTLKDAPEWEKAVSANTDPYGACAIRYAARWANLMEAGIASGARLEDVAKSASSEANKEGITGFMYGCAVSILSQVWVHGDELRRWHNLDTQIGNEGEKANESGGVLNPALLSIG